MDDMEGAEENDSMGSDVRINTENDCQWLFY